MKTIVVDVSKCIGCYNCQLACKDEHSGNTWLPIAREQPLGHFWMKVTQTERGTNPKIVVDRIPLLCQHCENPLCQAACQDGAIYQRDDGIVLIDPEKCTGCQDCVEACPYGVIYTNAELHICQKCTLCAHLLDDGWKEPRCVTACPTGALAFGEPEELADVLAQSEELQPGNGAKPQIQYLNLPKSFIAGEVISPKENICIENAVVTVKDNLSGEIAQVQTDNYGDFWVKNLKGSAYSLTIAKEGYYPKEIRNVLTDLNVGEIRLYRR